jgi:quercetin 2,3-dioxygenase
LVLPWSTTRWDPFLVLGDARFSKVGFGWHPHRGFQTVTLVLEGELEHRDNAGGSGVLGRGDAQYMVAGRYAMHYELAHGPRPARTLELWLNLPHELKVIDTRYVDLPAAEAGLATGPARPARVYAGRVGNVTGGPAERAKQFRLIDAQLDPGGELLPDIPYSHAAVVYVVDGDVQTGGCTVATEQSAWCDPGAGVPGPITVRASKPSHIVVYRVRAHPRTGRRAGPFVMSTEEEIQQAFADFEAGWFGPTPA